MHIDNLLVGKEYLRVHAYVGQERQIVKIIKVEEKKVTFIQTYPTESHKGGNKIDSFNQIECNRYLHNLANDCRTHTPQKGSISSL